MGNFWVNDLVIFLKGKQFFGGCGRSPGQSLGSRGFTLGCPTSSLFSETAVGERDEGGKSGQRRRVVGCPQQRGQQWLVLARLSASNHVK